MKRTYSWISLAALTLFAAPLTHGAETPPATQAGTRPATQAATAPASQPATQAATAPAEVLILKATDEAEIAKAEGKKAAITGEVESSAWSKSGKVLNITFKGAGTAFQVAVLSSNKEAMDAAFAGDIAKQLKGKTICVTGNLKKYQGHMEILSDDPKQIVVVVK